MQAACQSLLKSWKSCSSWTSCFRQKKASEPLTIQFPTSVVCDRLIANRARAGALALQRCDSLTSENGRQTRESADIKDLRPFAFFAARRAIDMQSRPEASLPFRMLRRVSETRHRFDGGGGNVKNSQRNACGALPDETIYRHRLASFHIREANCPRSLPSLRV